MPPSNPFAAPSDAPASVSDGNTSYQILPTAPASTAAPSPAPIGNPAVQELFADLSAPADVTPIVRGFLSFPTDPPLRDIIAGNAWLRVGDPIFFNSSAGSGKSVAMGQFTLAWPLDLPYMGIRPARPLRVLHFVGEDDESTMGQIREGFLTHSQALTGRRLTADDLAPLDSLVRTDFNRQFVGNAFIARLDSLLTEEPADVVIVNPLLSYAGGNIVETAGPFLREGLMPVLKRHRAAAVIAHHTNKLQHKDAFDEMHLVYSGTGGAEVANVPRSVITMVPTKVRGLAALHVGKRQTTGWKDADGKPSAVFYVRRTDDPTRPAWLPVPHDEAEELLAGQAAQSAGNPRKKVSPADVCGACDGGPTQRTAVIEWVMRKYKCSDSTAKNAIRDAENEGFLDSFTEKNPRGGHAIKWLCHPGQKPQGVD